ncbi:hypothetical protein BKA59DRAFT_65770 [Fusarium tricinctum]|uniref:Uncharacterized protein n=1 Tax=Fusarium tricinctum TaxID=61284 RepID=A0A8K0SCA6_9HYPO|nr:hypothetical protein BKA59DRAFT_65770 [Fusarium tricinctum]
MPQREKAEKRWRNMRNRNHLYPDPDQRDRAISGSLQPTETQKSTPSKPKLGWACRMTTPPRPKTQKTPLTKSNSKSTFHLFFACLALTVSFVCNRYPRAYAPAHAITLSIFRFQASCLLGVRVRGSVCAVGRLQPIEKVERSKVGTERGREEGWRCH